VPAVTEDGRHRAGGGSRRPVIAGGLAVLVVLGAAAGTAALRSGSSPPPPRSLERAAPSLTAPTTDAAATRAAPGPAGTMKAAPVTTPARTTAAPAPSTTATTPASRGDRPAPVPATGTAGPSAAGRATFYTLGGLPACGYGDAAATGRYVALGPAAFGGSAACGTVLDVTGPKGTVRVTVSDLCPECEAGHVDLAAPAFAAIAEPVAGIVPVTVARVVDPPAGTLRIRVKEGSSQYWLAVLPIGAGNPLTAVEARVGGSWQRLTRSGYGYWLAAKGTGPGPATLRLTDDRGHTATATVPVTPGATTDTGTRLY
jgi:expansin